MQMIDVIYELRQNNAEWNKSSFNYSTKYIKLIKPVLLAVAQSRKLLGALVLLSHMMSHMMRHMKRHMMGHMMGHMMHHMRNGYPIDTVQPIAPADHTRDDSQTHQKLFRQEGGEAAGGEAAGGEAGEDFVS